MGVGVLRVRLCVRAGLRGTHLCLWWYLIPCASYCVSKAVGLPMTSRAQLCVHLCVHFRACVHPGLLFSYLYLINASVVLSTCQTLF